MTWQKFRQNQKWDFVPACSFRDIAARTESTELAPLKMGLDHPTLTIYGNRNSLSADIVPGLIWRGLGVISTTLQSQQEIIGNHNK